MTREEFFKWDLKNIMRKSFIEGIHFAINKINDTSDNVPVKVGFEKFFNEFLEEQVANTKEGE